MILDALTVSIIALVCYFVLPFLLILTVRNERILRIITWIIFVVYLGILILGVWTRVAIKNGVVNISLDFDYGFFNKSISWGFAGLKLFDIAVNLFMLIPIGLSYCILAPKPFLKQLWTGVLIGLIVGFVIEIGQFLLPVKRSVQLSDVIFNTISVTIGVLLGKLMLVLNKFKKDHNNN